MKKYLSLLLLFALLVSALCGCGATASTEAAVQSAGNANGKFSPMDAPTADYGYTDGVTTYSMTTVETEEDVAVTEPQRVMAEKIIYSADVQMETMEFDETISALDKAIAAFGGFVENSEVNGDTSYLDDGSVHIRNRNAFYKVRIPAEKLDDFLRQTGTYGNVIGSSKSAQNVTSQYTDFEARRTSLETQEARLLELIAEANDIEALITLETKLADVRYEIESIQRSLNDLDSRIAYSTVDMYVREVEIYRPTPTVQRSFWQRMGDAFVRGWKGFVRGIENFLIGISGSVFTLLILAGIGVGAFFVVRKIVRKKRAKKNDE